MAGSVSWPLLKGLCGFAFTKGLNDRAGCCSIVTRSASFEVALLQEQGVQPVKLAGAGRVVCQFAKFVATRGKHVLSRNYLRPIRLTPSLKASLPLCHGSRGQGPSSLFARLGRVCPPANRIGRTGGGPTKESGWPPWPPWDFSGFFCVFLVAMLVAMLPIR